MKLLNPLVAVALLSCVSACKKVERIEVEPKTVSFTEAGQKESLKARALTADGQPVEGVQFAFTSSDPRVATVDDKGTVLAVKSGSAHMEVQGDKKSAKVPVEVSIPASIVVKGTPLTLMGVGSTATVEATVEDDAGRPVKGAAVELSSADPSIAEVSGMIVTAKGAGKTTLSATSGALRQQVDVTVTLPEVASLAIEEAPASLKVGESVALRVIAKSADGAGIAGITPAFASSNEKLATVDASGTVTAVKPGSVTISVTNGDKSASTKITLKK